MSLVPSPPPDANGNGTNNVRGLVSLVAQVFAGAKTFLGAVVMSAGLTLNGAVNQMVRVTPPATVSGTSYANPVHWYEITGSNQTNMIQIGSGITASTWEFAVGFYTGALAPLIQSRGNMFLSVASGGYIAPISPGVNDFGAITNYWRRIYATAFTNSNGTGGTDVCTLVGTSQSLGSVHASAELLRVACGIGGTESGRLAVYKGGQTEGFSLGAPGVTGRLSLDNSVGWSLAWSAVSLVIDSAKYVLSGGGLTINSASNSPISCSNRPFFLYASGGSGITETLRLVGQRADSGLKCVVAGTEQASPNAASVLFQTAKGVTTAANDDGNGTATGIQVFGDGHIKARATLALNEDGVAKPTAGAAYRGTLWYSKSANGSADTVEICLKSAADTYSWVTLATG